MDHYKKIGLISEHNLTLYNITLECMHMGARRHVGTRVHHKFHYSSSISSVYCLTQFINRKRENIHKGHYHALFHLNYYSYK